MSDNSPSTAIINSSYAKHGSSRLSRLSRVSNPRSFSQTSRRTITPQQYLLPAIKTHDDLWNIEHEAVVNEQIRERASKQREEAQRKKQTVAQFRALSVDLLAHEWLSLQQFDLEVTIFLIEKTLPTLVLGVEKLAAHVHKLGLVEVGAVPNFNPINYLAQFLMRNNPRFTISLGGNSYTNTLKDAIQDIKTDFYAKQNNRLARFKAEARKRLEERKKQEEMRSVERERRFEVIKRLFSEWVSPALGFNKLDYATLTKIMNNFFAPFVEQLIATEHEVGKSPAVNTLLEMLEQLLGQRSVLFIEVRELLERCSYETPTDVFNALMEHLAKATLMYRLEIEREQRRKVVEQLFNELDFGQTGNLDRKRILYLLEVFYGKLPFDIRLVLRDPTKWPIVEMDEEEEPSLHAANRVDFERTKSSHEIERVKTATEALEKLVQSPEFRDRLEHSRSSSDLRDFVRERSRPSAQLVLPPPPDEETRSELDTTAVPDAQPVPSPPPPPPVDSAAEPVDADVGNKPIQPEPAETQLVAGEQPQVLQAGEEPKQLDAGEEPTVQQVDAEPQPATTEAEQPPPEQQQAIDQETGEGIAAPAAESAAASGEPEVKVENATAGAERHSESGVTGEGGSGGAQKSAPAVPGSPERPTQPIAQPQQEQQAEEKDKAAEAKAQEKEMEEERPLVPSPMQSERDELETPSTPDSAFDPNHLSLEQFRTLIENFLGNEPNNVIFKQLASFFRTAYFETEEERKTRMIEVQREQLKKRRLDSLNKLFQKWDNEGSGHLLTDDVIKVLNGYRDGNFVEQIQKSREDLKWKTKKDKRITKKLFRFMFGRVAWHVNGNDMVEPLVDYCNTMLDRAYAEKMRGELRRKWLAELLATGESNGTNIEPLYKAVFQVMLRDAEKNGNNKRVSASIALLEKNRDSPSRGNMKLHYVACTPEDTRWVLGQELYQDMKNVSFEAVQSGKPLHIVRVQLNPNVHFFNTNRTFEDRLGALLVVPLKDQRSRVFGTLCVDTMNDFAHQIFQTHEIQFLQGVARALSIGYHTITLRKQLAAMAQAAMVWMYYRSQAVVESTLYLVERSSTATLTKKYGPYVLRKLLYTTATGEVSHISNSPRLTRKESLFRDYLFKSVDSSESVSADAYGKHHITYPIRDLTMRTAAVVDIGIAKEQKNMPDSEKRSLVKILKVLQLAFNEIHKEINPEPLEATLTNLTEASQDKGQEPPAEQRDDDSSTMLFNQMLLNEVKQNLARLDAQSYAELKSYKEPPRMIHSIVQAVLALFYPDMAEEGTFGDWNQCKPFISMDLGRKILEYDPMDPAQPTRVDFVLAYLKDIPRGSVANKGSKPADFIYNWLYISMNLLDHARTTARTTNAAVAPPSNANEAQPAPEGAGATGEAVAGEQQPADAQAAETQASAAAAATSNAGAK